MPLTCRLPSVRLTAVLVALIGVCFTAPAPAADVTGFRGTDGLARSQEVGLPVSWSSSENVVWRVKMPGPGTSSPIVLGERIYVTSYTGYGLVPNQGDQANLKRQVLCLDRASGRQIWRKEFAAKLPESNYSGGNNARHGYASSTPTTDGKHLYVFFGKSGVFCLDLDGNTVWTADVGSNSRGWGSSNSPVLFKNVLIINASVESGRLLALDKSTGKEVWSVSQIRGAWNTPLLAEVEGGGPELVISLPQQVRGLDPS
ncbi:MAG: PQQ-binding-like beta-propeller repeat protein, partial [Planctomycetaceae bacterium]